MDDLAAKLEVIFSDVFWGETASIREMTRMGSTTWDSLAHLNLLLAIEQEFKVALDDDEVARVNSFESVLAVVADKVGAK